MEGTEVSAKLVPPRSGKADVGKRWRLASLDAPAGAAWALETVSNSAELDKPPLRQIVLLWVLDLLGFRAESSVRKGRSEVAVRPEQLAEWMTRRVV